MFGKERLQKGSLHLYHQINPISFVALTWIFWTWYFLWLTYIWNWVEYNILWFGGFLSQFWKACIHLKKYILHDNQDIIYYNIILLLLLSSQPCWCAHLGKGNDISDVYNTIWRFQLDLWNFPFPRKILKLHDSNQVYHTSPPNMKHNFMTLNFFVYQFSYVHWCPPLTTLLYSLINQIGKLDVCRKYLFTNQVKTPIKKSKMRSQMHICLPLPHVSMSNSLAVTE